MKEFWRGFGSLGLIMILLVSIVPFATSGGLGMGPVRINMNGKWSEEYERLVTVYSSFEDDIFLSLSAQGSCSEWISFHPLDDPDETIDSFELEAGSKEKIFVRIKVPEEVPIGEYKCTVYAKQDKESGEGEQSFALRVRSDITFEVLGDQELEGNIRTVSIRNIEEGNPLVVEMDFENTGNVIATPRAETDIIKNGVEIDSFSYEEIEVKPGDVKTLTITRNSDKWSLGEYRAELKVYLEDEKIYDRDSHDFEVLKRGTYTAEGKLLDISYSEELIIGEVGKITLKFENTGEMDLMAKFVGEVFKEDKLIDTIQGEEFLVKEGEKKDILAYFEPEDSGSYKIEGKISFAGKDIKTGEIVMEFKEPQTADFSTSEIKESSKNSGSDITGELIKKDFGVVSFFSTAGGSLLIGLLIGISITAPFIMRKRGRMMLRRGKRLIQTNLRRYKND